MSEYFKLKGSEVQSIDTICYLPVDLVSYVLYLYTVLKWKIIYQYLLALFYVLRCKCWGECSIN